MNPTTPRHQNPSPKTWDKKTWDELHDGRLAELILTAQSAGDHTLKYFGSPDLAVDAKSDDSPVTIADRQSETLVRERIADRFGDDAVAGEEHDDTEGTSGYRWTVDPIDGTKSFICGVPLYSTLLALEFDGRPLGGAIVLPALRQMVVAAVGHGCFQKSGDSDWQMARCRPAASIDGCVFVTSQVSTFARRGADAVYRDVEQRAKLTRTWGDGYGYAMVATGRADVMIDPMCSPWDVAAMLPIMTEAGGRFSDWRGDATAHGGDGIGTAGGAIHDEVLRLVSKHLGDSDRS